MSKEKIPKAIRNAVWNHNIGNSKEGECYTGCGEKISINNFACGHVISEKKGGKVILDNLKPICVACNSSMGTMKMMMLIQIMIITIQIYYVLNVSVMDMIIINVIIIQFQLNYLSINGMNN